MNELIARVQRAQAMLDSLLVVRQQALLEQQTKAAKVVQVNGLIQEVREELIAAKKALKDAL